MSQGAALPATRDQLARDFTRRVLTIADPRIRSLAVSERLQRLRPDSAAQLLHNIWLAACDNEQNCQQVLIDLASNVPLSETLPYEFASQLYEASRELALADVARLLLSPTWKKADNLEALNAMPGVELGRRVAMARRQDRDTLDRLMRDPEPKVTRVLLDNPRLVERDVVLMAARRPVDPEALLVIFRHPRWLTQPQVKLALAANPHLPSDAALALLPFLTAAQLRGIARDEHIATAVRMIADRLAINWLACRCTRDVVPRAASFPERD